MGCSSPKDKQFMSAKIFFCDECLIFKIINYNVATRKSKKNYKILKPLKKNKRYFDFTLENKHIYIWINTFGKNIYPLTIPTMG